MLALVFVLMQLMISAKAGLVNYIEGQANVALHEQVPAASPVETGRSSHVELLLNPGTFLRLDENSAVVLDSVELTNIAVRLISGTALIESADADKQSPIHVTTGNLRVMIVTPGVYRFSGDTATVLDGKLQTADAAFTIKKGHEISAIGSQYEQSKTGANIKDDLDDWSHQRSAALAKANTLAYHGYSNNSLYPFGAYRGFPNGASWIYSPFLNGFTFIPFRNYRSYYGYSFVPLFVYAPRIIARPTVQTQQPTTKTIVPKRPPSNSVGGPAARPHPPAAPIGRSSIGTSHPHSGRGGGHFGR